MQSLNKKERKILELQITKTSYPKSVADGLADGQREWTHYLLEAKKCITMLETDSELKDKM